MDSLHDQSIDVWTLPSNERKRLIHYLELSCITIADWRMFADELGYSYTDINRISRQNRTKERPTILLFNLLISKYPSFTLEELIRVCMKAPDCYSAVVEKVSSLLS